MLPPTSASPFGPDRRCGEPPDAAALAEEVIVSIIERALDADPDPTRKTLLRDANRRGERPPSLSVARLLAIAPNASGRTHRSGNAA